MRKREGEGEGEFARGLLSALASERALPVATNGVTVGVAGFAAASFAFKVQTRAAATVLAKTCCTGTLAAAALAAVVVVVTESCRRFVAESSGRVSTVDCGSLHDNAPCRICMRAATT